jgi:uncharacterized protein (TIGR03083 family)
MQLNGMSHESFEDLIGAYALDACDEDEVAAVEAYVAEHPEANASVERLRAAAAWLGASGPLMPPPDLRANVLERANAIEPASGVDAYTELTDAFEQELRDLPRDAIETVTHNGLTIRQLVAHLTAIDAVFMDELLPTASGRPFIDANTVVEITDDALAEVGDVSFDDIFREWKVTRGKLRDAANAAPDQNVMGYSTDDALVIRAFETWTHLDDVRRIAGRPGFVPAASVLRAMGDLSVRVVPYALAVHGRSRPGESVKIVLTGPGGRAWHVPLAPGEVPQGGPATVMTVDIVDWCARFADRMAPEALTVQVEGDRAVADDVVLSAPAFAGL